MYSELPSKANKERAVVVTISLLLMQLILLSLQIRGASGTLLFKTWTLTLQAPIIAVSSGITRGVRNVWYGYIWLVGARSENEQLQATVRRLSLLNSSYKEVEQENIRLRHLIALRENIDSSSISARVVARAPTFLSNVIYIDRGSKDGIRVNAPVLSSEGIIGRTVIVSDYQSQVQLISNEDASIGAMLEHSRTPGVIRGTGNRLLDLNFISNTEHVAVGDMVLSSGLDGIFPKGLPIGRVTELQKGNELFWSITVEPTMDLIHIEEVLVLLDDSKQEM